MDTDLHDVIRLNNKISRQHKQFFMYQLMRGLKYIHSAGVIHRDIKPQNLLVNDKCELRICDFGLATVKNERINATYDLTPYVVTRWFRAPELLLKYQTKNYNSKIDMWSAGCVLAELYLRKVLFGEKDLGKQVQRFVALLGPLPQHLMEQIKDQSVRTFLNDCVKKTKRVSFEELFPGIEKDALDLMRRLLCYDPAERISAEEAMEHPFFKELHQKENEPGNARIEYFDFEFEQYTLDRKILRELIVDEILLYHSKEARDYYEKCKVKYPKGVLEILYQRVGAQPQTAPRLPSSCNSSAVKQPNQHTQMEGIEDVDTAPGSVNNSPPAEDGKKQQQPSTQHAQSIVAQAAAIIMQQNSALGQGMVSAATTARIY